jgi:hypothetical protein
MKNIFILLLGVLIMSLEAKTKLTNSEHLFNIPEASGMVISGNDMFVANDEGYLYMIKDFETNHKKERMYIGDYDIEGLAIDGDNLFILLEELKTILIIDKNSALKHELKVINSCKIKRKFNKKNLYVKKGDGFEGITIDKDIIYISNQSNKIKYSHIFTLDKNEVLQYQKVKAKSILEKSNAIDIAGMDVYKNKLYYLSDKSNRLYIKKLNRLNNKPLIIKMEKGYAQEGLFLTDEFIYIADDNGKIIRYKNTLD